MPLDGTQLKPREAAKILWDAGWVNADNLMIMVAVAYAESSLFTQAYNHNTNGTTDWGWLQLNDGPAADIEKFKAVAFDPRAAAKVARPMYEQRSFSPWVAYKTGAWEKFIPQATVGVANMLRVIHGVEPLL